MRCGALLRALNEEGAVLRFCFSILFKAGYSSGMATKRKHSGVAGYHLIWTVYGWWLANDPRGSTSLVLRVESLAALGDLHEGRKAVQPPRHVIREFYEDARDQLKHPRAR